LQVDIPVEKLCVKLFKQDCNPVAFEGEVLKHLNDIVGPLSIEECSVTLKDKDSLWKVSSAMQKSIRRGMPELALAKNRRIRLASRTYNRQCSSL